MYRAMEILRYTDSHNASDFEDKKLIIKWYFFYGRVIVTWYNKQSKYLPWRQSNVAINQDIREML